jgi:2-haloacid dehalogenase
MSFNRRKFLGLATSASAAMLLPLEAFAATSRIRAIAFDGFVIFDPRSVATRAEEVFPGRGTEFANAWRTQQFEYSWIRTAAQQYTDFWHVTEDALEFTATKLKLPLKPETKQRLMHAYLELQPWPDAREALERWKSSGIRMAFLSNFTAEMLEANLANAKLRSYFEEHLTTDRVKAYKPSPKAYQMGVDAFGLRKDQIAFAAFGGWDAAGAKLFGYPTVWVNRTSAPAEVLGATPDATVANLKQAAEFISKE